MVKCTMLNFHKDAPWLIFRYNMVQEGEIIVFFKAAQNSTCQKN